MAVSYLAIHYHCPRLNIRHGNARIHARMSNLTGQAEQSALALHISAILIRARNEALNGEVKLYSEDCCFHCTFHVLFIQGLSIYARTFEPGSTLHKHII